MKKEAIIAIVFGIVLGDLVAVFILAKNKESQMDKNKTMTSSITITPKAALDMSSCPLEIENPQDREIVEEKEVTIKGKATKDSLIIIESSVDYKVIKNEKETFEVDFILALGENNIKVTAYSKDTQSKIQEKELKVYYLDEQL